MTSVVAPDCNDNTMSDCRRTQARRRVLLTGKIVQDDGAVRDCAIRNLSEQGAQVRVGDTHWLPDEFYLIEVRSGSAHRAEVSWRSSSLAGLRLSDRIDLNHPTVKALARLRQIWLDSIPK